MKCKTLFYLIVGSIILSSFTSDYKLKPKPDFCGPYFTFANNTVSATIQDYEIHIGACYCGETNNGVNIAAGTTYQAAGGAQFEGGNTDIVLRFPSSFSGKVRVRASGNIIACQNIKNQTSATINFTAACCCTHTIELELDVCGVN